MAPRSDALVDTLAIEIDRTLLSLLEPDAPVALVNFPNHGNPGDPAIWLGERAALRRVRSPVAYQAAWSSYDPQALRRAVPDGPILLNGGGNFGDRWPGQQETRERVLSDFPGRSVIQFPQSIEFRDRSRLARMQALVEHHGAFTVLARDHRSLAFAQESFAARVLLCPDMAFSLGELARPTPASTPILWLARTDEEASGYEVPRADDVVATDWWPPAPLASRSGRALLALNRRIERWMDRPGSAPVRLWPLLAATFEPLARAWVDAGLRVLARGQVVVTDRLHGHVLSLLMSIPHVVLDNGSGKVRALYDTFTSSSPVAHWASDPDEALELARALVRS